MAEVARAKIVIESSENTLSEISGKINDSLSRMPNLISEDVPVGADEDSNNEVSKWGETRKFDFDVKGPASSERALGCLILMRCKLTGSGLLFMSQLAKLERALINFFLDEHEKAGYEEAIPPYIVSRRQCMEQVNCPNLKDLFKIDDTGIGF